MENVEEEIGNIDGKDGDVSICMEEMTRNLEDK